MEPITLRVSHFFFSLSMIFAFNAIFYSDEYIEGKAADALAGTEVIFIK